MCIYYLSCQNPTEDDACGTCPNCVKYNKLAHPDLHFVFPIIKKKNKSFSLQLLDTTQFNIKEKSWKSS